MEKKFKNVKVAIKFRDVFFTIFGMLLLLMISCMLSFTFICSNMKEFHDISYQNSVLQMEMRKDLQVVDRMILWSIIKDNQEEKNLFVQQADEFLKQFEANVEKLKETFPDKEHIDELMVEMDKGNEIRKEVISHISANDNESALALFNGEYTEASTSLQNVLIEIGEHLEEDADYQYKVTIIIAVCSFVTMLIVGTVCFVFIRKASALLTRLINEPINEIEAATKEMKAGNLDVKISYESGDELGMLAENFSETCSELHEIVEETDLLLSEMAKGNFNINTTKEEKFVGQFSGIILSMRNLNRQMDETIRQIKAVAEHVAAGSTQLAGSAEELAEGATEQAGAIQEITASIENVASISRDSAKSAQGACEMVNRTVEDAKKSQTELQELTSAMTRISETSKEIQNIIGAIEDIAEQTNMLSLNASIEAARAGEAGKGFAVVADQIGKLATDSAQSAASTRELINKALAEIENGNAVTEKTVHALQEILNGMNSFAEAAYGASQASEMQADMLIQIQDGIEHISSVVQGNSAQAQETSATSQELSAQSENLLELVSHFKLRS